MKTTKILQIAFLSIILFSCKKEHSCQCTTTSNGDQYTETKFHGEMRKSPAKKACKAYNHQDSYYTVACNLQ